MRFTSTNPSSPYKSLRRFNYRLNQLEPSGPRKPVVAQMQAWSYTEFEEFKKKKNEDDADADLLTSPVVCTAQTFRLLMLSTQSPTVCPLIVLFKLF